MSTFTVECRHTPNTSVKDRILYYNIRTFIDVCRQSQICSGGGRKESSRQRGDWLFPAKSIALMGVSQRCQSYAKLDDQRKIKEIANTFETEEQMKETANTFETEEQMKETANTFLKPNE
ncbi:hypothetical protein TNCV_4816271 [Trichonephila clavipes]|nr:hypothetical protein TNCV_4816271 [Trichonephila clavipes]